MKLRKDIIKRFRGSKIYFFITGISCTVWFLIRVIPKPSRAGYPCMKVAAPFASSFVIYLTGLFATALGIKKIRDFFNQRKKLYIFLFVPLVIISVLLTKSSNRIPVFANNNQSLQTGPLGTGKGINPGRVVWAYDQDATNQYCKNKLSDGYHLPRNNDMNVIQQMYNESVMQLTGQTNITSSWDSLFIFFNRVKGREPVNYQEGEKIFIKLNLVGSGSFELKKENSYTMSYTSPQAVKAILCQLVDTLGIKQENISVGDPMRVVNNYMFAFLSEDYPDINYVGRDGGEGRIQVKPGDSPVIFYSDRGKVLRTGTWNDASEGDTIWHDRLYTVLEDADYMINICALKGHHRNGITLAAKNHFGSHTRENAKHLHNGMPNPDGRDDPTRLGYGKYRVMVDIMGHKLLGGNTILYVVDGLWGGPDANDPPCKWQIPPFNTDWTSSVFMSQDPVAIESVALDFLQAEFTSDKHKKTWPHMNGVDDYLMQAADPDYWPDDIVYDPEKDGIPLQSLGVFEHWNNSIDRKYSRNLGENKGIELVYVGPARIPAKPILPEVINKDHESALIGWTDVSSKETQYAIELSDDGDNFSQVALVNADTEQFEISGLDPNTAYYFRIRTINNEITSDYSEIISVHTEKETGIFGGFSDKGIKIYPNPVRNVAMLEIPDLKGQVLVEVYNMNGQIVDKLKLHFIQNTSPINFENYKKGYYILNIFTPEKQHYIRILKE